jgi:hypothetical protein
MARINAPHVPAVTHEGGPASRIGSLAELRHSVLTCLLWEDAFYESGEEIATRIARLVAQVTARVFTKTPQITNEQTMQAARRGESDSPHCAAIYLACGFGCGVLVKAASMHKVLLGDGWSLAPSRAARP